MPRDSALARYKPLKRSKAEEAIMIKLSGKKAGRKPSGKPIAPPGKKQKSTATGRKPAKKSELRQETRKSPIEIPVSDCNTMLSFYQRRPELSNEMAPVKSAAAI
jgi:hypothetical protein